MLTKSLPLNLIICAFIITLAWLLFQAVSDAKWSLHREVLTPIYCFTLDTIDQLTLQIALWRLAAYSLYCTVLYLIYPQNSLKMAY